MREKERDGGRKGESREGNRERRGERERERQMGWSRLNSMNDTSLLFPICVDL